MRLKQLAGRLSTAQLASHIRSRRWLATASAICVLILGLIVLFQPADDDGFAVEEVDFAEFEDVTVGEQPFDSVSERLAEPELPVTTELVDARRNDSIRKTATLIPTAVPQPDQGVLPLTAASAGSVEKFPVWLTGTIEEEEVTAQPAVRSAERGVRNRE